MRLLCCFLQGPRKHNDLAARSCKSRKLCVWTLFDYFCSPKFETMAKQSPRRTGRAGARSSGKPGTPGKRQTSSSKRTDASSRKPAGTTASKPGKFKSTAEFAKFKKADPKGLKPKRQGVGEGDRKESHTKFRSDLKFSQYGHKNRFEKKDDGTKPLTDNGEVRLNKYLANAGIASRREADKLIQDGLVTVNGEVVTQMGSKVKPGDEVRFGDDTVKAEKLAYVLLNKPKDFITTTKDTHNRKTVMNLVDNACKERVVPVGRLDRNTTGLLLFTNDGDLARKLTHPRYNVKKIYHVVTDKPVAAADLEKLVKGVHLEDGPAKADVATWVGLAEDKKHVGVELHSGKNRVVRRMFEALGYKVMKLDRVYFAGLTKKNLPRGRWKILTEKEVALLRMVH